MLLLAHHACEACRPDDGAVAAVRELAESVAGVKIGNDAVRCAPEGILPLMLRVSRRCTTTAAAPALLLHAAYG